MPGRKYPIPVLSGMVAAMILLLGSMGPAAASADTPQANPELEIWSEFVTLLRSGEFPADRIKPMASGLEVAMKGYLDQMRSMARWEEWEKAPEVQKNGTITNYIIPLRFGESEPADYCFMFIREGGQWYFHHLESVFIRLDKTPSPPTSDFPDSTEGEKAWDREEFYWSKIISWRNTIAKDMGKEYFYDMIRDGAGYYVWAKSRTPFVQPHRAFILFLCWEQANLRGNNTGVLGLPKVRLEKLTDEEAVVRFSPIYFTLYKVAAHIKPQISLADYRELFEVIWQDRAKAAGWTLSIDYIGLEDAHAKTECVFRFSRKDL